MLLKAFAKLFSASGHVQRHNALRCSAVVTMD
nr:MAG TPA: hypothetical protein [Caudoviricetes sp.]